MLLYKHLKKLQKYKKLWKNNKKNNKLYRFKKKKQKFMFQNFYKNKKIKKRVI